ncbi:MAG: ribonuclease III [Alphaproteobacteria bacterium]|nr:ribonuclease III [Alphaproteobacteria bacterium]
MTDSTPHPLEQEIQYIFADKSLLQAALTHSSIYRKGARHKGSDFERLEFLGDRVLGIVIAEFLYQKYPKETEGDLAKRQAVLVSRDVCNRIAEIIDLRTHLLYTQAENFSINSAILANAMEALLGAIYLDRGLRPCQDFIIRLWQSLDLDNARPPRDAKTELQEWAQSKNRGVPIYKVLDCSGPDHSPIFRIAACVDKMPESIGSGASKRQAEQQAALNLLTLIKTGNQK